jgi:copper oxidase (laccase) domain-containing protein
VLAWWTTRAHGDQRNSGSSVLTAALGPRSSLLALRQAHGADVVIDRPGHDGVELVGDALVSDRPGRALMVRVADCAAVALGSPEGVFGAVHVGWRGLLGGVLERAVDAVRALGASGVVAGLGPCIGPCCYAFTGPPLETLSARYGAAVRGRTRRGEEALDLAGAVRNALARSGVSLAHDEAVCTGCAADTWSHRVRGDVERQALVVWSTVPL